MTYIVVRFNCHNYDPNLIEQALVGCCKNLVGATGTPYEIADRETSIFSIYQTEEPTAYREVVAELACDAEGEEGPLDEALKTLEEEVQAHQGWLDATSEEQRRDEKRGLYSKHDDPSN